jgi:ribosomal protein S6--L-glutamate ligase
MSETALILQGRRDHAKQTALMGMVRTVEMIHSPAKLKGASPCSRICASGTGATLLVALEGHLKRCPHVMTLGVRPNFSDYSAHEQQLIQAATKIYYPSAFYADLFNVMGKATFPSYHTYKFAQDKIKQTALFSMTGIPHPRTRVFYGPRQKQSILKYFDLPLIAKVARGSALGRGVFLIRTAAALAEHCRSNGAAYIQEYLPIDRDIRVVVIGSKVVNAYWRVAPPGEYRTNVAAGGRIDLAPVPEAALALALQTAACCGWDNVGIDICMHQDRLYVLEANMKYGREGFRRAGIDYAQLMERLIRDGEI